MKWICKSLWLVIFVLSKAASAFSAVSTVNRPQQDRIKQLEQKAYTPEDLSKLLVSYSTRTPGSLRHQRGWTHWSQVAVDTIRYNLSLNLPVQADSDGFSDLWFQLGVAADTGEMPSFECAGSRSGYALEFFCRALLLADLLLDPTFPTSWKSDTDAALKRPYLQNYKECHLMSIGGGPGYDHVSAALVASFHNVALGSEQTTVSSVVFDYEEGWHDLVESMSTATDKSLRNDSHSCSWGGKCDITKPLSDPCNEACLEQASKTNLFVCQYCVAENANDLRDSNFSFFVDLFQRASEGALFIFTETSPRLWPDFVDLVESRPELRDMEVGFVRNVGRGKCGPQLILRKGHGREKFATLDLEQRALCNDFRQMQVLQDRKMSNNFQRQRRRVPGEK